jgi:hypothetical protein
VINQFVITSLLKIKNNKNNVYVPSVIFSKLCTSVEISFFLCVTGSLVAWFPKFQREVLRSCSLAVGSTRIDHMSLEDDNKRLGNAEDYLINDATPYLRRLESSGTRL